MAMTGICRAFVASGCDRSDRKIPFSLSLRLQRTRQHCQRAHAAKFEANADELSTDLRRFSQIRNRSALVAICENLRNLWILLLVRRFTTWQTAVLYSIFLSFF